MKPSNYGGVLASHYKSNQSS